MRLLRAQRASRAVESRRGAVLLLSFLVLLVLILILQQIDFSTKTSDRVNRNELTLQAMDMAIESTMISVFENLKSDGEADASAGEGAGPAGALSGLGDGSSASGDGAGEEGAGGGGPSDSHMDEWWGVNRQDFSSMDDIRVRVLVQDEDSKFNVLSILIEDEEQQRAAMERLARVIENSRKGTEKEIDRTTSERMAQRILQFLTRRKNEIFPKPVLSTDDEEEPDHGMLLDLRELLAVDPELFKPDYFVDSLDERGQIVHSLGSFLTCWTALTTSTQLASSTAPGATGTGASADGAQGSGSASEEGNPLAQNSSDDSGRSGDTGSQGDGSGDASGIPGASSGSSEGPTGLINVNTAPVAVLAALLDRRDTPYDLWESVLRYRNEPDDSLEENEDPPLDEFGDEIQTLKFFDSLEELSETESWDDLDPTVASELQGMLTVQSQVFSIYFTAYKPTGEERTRGSLPTREDTENEEANPQGLVRTVRCVVWRRASADGTVELVPLVRWDELDYVPYEVLDFPDRDHRPR